MRQNADVELLVAADDRTGAFETAAAIADLGAGPVPVTAFPDIVDDGQVSVIDLGCRHLSPAEAAERAAAVPPATFRAHKTDSTLRGNWADELVARARSQPVLLVPSLPSLGRTCVGGVVLENGRPVNEGAAGTDVRRRVLTARPSEAIVAAGAPEVVELHDATQVAAWIAAPSGFAVADASSDDEIAEIVDGWRTVAGDVLLAGTSAVVGRAAGAVVSASAGDVPSLPRVDGPVLVACGSVHPASREQLEFAEQRGVTVTSIADDITIRALTSSGRLVLATEIPVGDVTEPMAVAAAASIARGVRDLVSQVEIGALVIIGGDTAAAVVGDGTVRVHGSVDVGTAWLSAEGFPMPIVTRSGGFGSERALFDLIARLRS